jgi:hypothetical protein
MATRRRRWRWSRRASTCCVKMWTGMVLAAASSGRWVATVRGRTVRPLGGGAAGVPVLAVQVDGAALGVVKRPHGDSNGAGHGGRGRAMQGQRRVRLSGRILVSVWLSQCRGGRSVHSGWSCKSLFWKCRNTVLQCASLNDGHTELTIALTIALVKAGADKDNNGYGSSGCILVSLGRHSSGRSWSLFGFAGSKRCTWRRRTATRRRRWRLSRRART